MDLHRKFEWNKCTKNNIKKCSLSQWTKVIKGDLINILKRFNKDNHQYIPKKYKICYKQKGVLKINEIK